MRLLLSPFGCSALSSRAFLWKHTQKTLAGLSSGRGTQAFRTLASLGSLKALVSWAGNSPWDVVC